MLKKPKSVAKTVTIIAFANYMLYGFVDHYSNSIFISTAVKRV